MTTTAARTARLAQLAIVCATGVGAVLAGAAAERRSVGRPAD